MLQLLCSGTPYEIGFQHGNGGKPKVRGSIAFYEELFKTTCSMEWAAVRKEAMKYVEPLAKLCPRYVDEMRGIADGAAVDFLDIISLNVRTEIAFGLFTLTKIVAPVDGCTSLGLKTMDGDSFLAQNWDWQAEQSQNLLICHVSQPGSGIADFVMVTEGGIIGKIGFNCHGVGICMNAIRARGLNPTHLPVHVALRAVLESPSRYAAIERLRSVGVSGSAYLLIGDERGSTGLECTSVGIQELLADESGKLVHANNLLLDHPGVDEPPWLEDSPKRTARLSTLVAERLSSTSTTFEELFEVFKDEQGYPAAINRCQVQGSGAQTLFNIMMNLTSRRAVVTFGRPTAYSERVELDLPMTTGE